MRQRAGRALHRMKPPLRHPRRANAKLGRAAAAVGDRLDHQRHVDAGFEPERHCFGGRGDIDGDEKVVDELDPAGGAEFTEVEAGIGDAGDDRFEFFAGRSVAGEIDHGLARGDQARRARHFAVDEYRALFGKRRDLPFFVRHRMRAELHHDLSGAGGMDEAMRSMHHLVERCGGRQAGEHDVGRRADFCSRARRHAADFFEFGKRAAAVTDHAIAAFDQIIRKRQTDFADADQTDSVHRRFHFCA